MTQIPISLGNFNRVTARDYRVKISTGAEREYIFSMFDFRGILARVEEVDVMLLETNGAKVSK